jgi:hypothetical protein
MALSSESESVLESAMKRITGEPGAPAGGSFRPAQYIPENVIGYSDEFGDRGRLGTVTGPVAPPPAETINVGAAAASPAATPYAAPAVATPAAAAPAAAIPPALWKSYGEYFAGNPDAAKYSNYHSSYLPGQTKPQKWGASGDPYRFSEEYNQYKTTLPRQYQDLINYGISPEQIKSGAVHSVLTPSGIQKIQGADYYQTNPLKPK